MEAIKVNISVMEREDYGLAFMLRYENIAWYDNGKVNILDRRIYPREIHFVECTTHYEVRDAIKNMVTQSAGPYTAVGMGMALASFESRNLKKEERIDYLKKASSTISSARPTTQKRMAAITESCIPVAIKAMESGDNPEIAIRDHVIELNNQRYKKIGIMAQYLSKKIKDGDKVMTQCFGETIVGMLARELKKQGKTIYFFTPETRPYFQGSRLTATVLSEMGFDTTVITDNMPAFVMQKEGIDLFTAASDAITMDGYVINKVGTLQIAICAKHFGVPVYITGAPDFFHKSYKDVKIEMRDPNESLYAMGIRTAKEGVKGYYPAFDLTPPELISGIVTDKGILSPYSLSTYFEMGGEGEY